MSWTAIDYWRKVQLLEQLNSELLRQGLPTVSEDTYAHRMGQAIGPLIRQSRKSKAGEELDLPPQNTAALVASSPQATGSEVVLDDRVTLPPIRSLATGLADYLPGEGDPNNNAES